MTSKEPYKEGKFILCAHCGNRESFTRKQYGSERFTEILRITNDGEIVDYDDHDTNDSEVDEIDDPDCRMCNLDAIWFDTREQWIDYICWHTSSRNKWHKEKLKKRNEKLYLALMAKELAEKIGDALK